MSTFMSDYDLIETCISYYYTISLGGFFLQHGPGNDSKLRLTERYIIFPYLKKKIKKIINHWFVTQPFQKLLFYIVYKS